MTSGKTLFIVFATLLLLAPTLLAPTPSHAQTLTTTMSGKWKIDVTASIEASKRTENERALSGARSLPKTVICEFLWDGTFTWGNAGGQWSVTNELEDGLRVKFQYPKFERSANVKVVDENTLHFHFRPDYPVCVYQRVKEPKD